MACQDGKRLYGGHLCPRAYPLGRFQTVADIEGAISCKAFGLLPDASRGGAFDSPLHVSSHTHAIPPCFMQTYGRLCHLVLAFCKPQRPPLHGRCPTSKVRPQTRSSAVVSPRPATVARSNAAWSYRHPQRVSRGKKARPRPQVRLPFVMAARA